MIPLFLFGVVIPILLLFLLIVLIGMDTEPNLSQTEKEEIHRALSDVLEFAKNDRDHKKEHLHNRCLICEGYRKLEKKFRKLVNEEE